MKGHIDAGGNLYITRGKKETIQACPYSREDLPCGDWCPLFSEPEQVEMLDSEIELSLCKKVLYFKTADFTDDRETAE